MLFNSLEFLLFLPIVFFLYWFVFNKELRLQNLLLLIASYFFYGWWSWEFMGLLALSTLLDYIYGFSVASPNRKKARIFLWLSIINNLGILAIFKYFNFFASQFQQGFEMLGLHMNPVVLNVALPVGISFYTFHGMSYVFDIYRGVQKPVKSLIDYGVFVSFFPLLVAGPIERANHLLPQVQKRREFNYSTAVEGGRLILWGLFKKVIIADSLAGVVDEIFLNYQHAGSAELVVGALFFAFQIYGDFSGYSDIALGTAKLFGIELLSNFRFPYFSRDIAEFWRRWHISLSSWFRDYLYIPLGGSRVGKVKAVRNTFIIFLVSGFWHGANWTFIVWGFIHACGFMPLLLTNRNRKYVSDVVAQGRSLPTGREFLQMLSTFVFVTFAWIFFRADSIGQAAEYVWGILSRVNQFNAGSFGWSTATGFALIAILLLLDWNFRYNERQLKSIPNLYLRRLVYASLIVALVVAILISNSQSFIYFQF